MIDKELLLKPRLAEDDYEIPGVGTVRVRSLSWDECAGFKTYTEKGKPLRDVYARILHKAMIDPQLTVDEALQWLAGAAGGEIEDLVRHINTSSGLVEGAQKSA